MSNEKGPEIKYVSPKESLEEEGYPERRLDLFVGGEKIGAATIDYYSKPLRLFQVTDLYVEHEFSGQGYASQIMEQVEKFLKDRKRPGVLVDAIIDGNPAKGMYERRGWKPVPGDDALHVFNWPENVPLDVLKGYAQRYTDLRLRQNPPAT
ncbi:MAG: hypothetical protein JWN64_382 [Parcubacteria group bacterium]|nr:hypothetical protein [Parcubacteria group bacterium]